MDIPMYQYQIDEVNVLLEGVLSKDERMAAELQLQYLLEERRVAEDFEKCGNIQRDFIKVAMQEEADEDIARNAGRKPLHDHTNFRKQISRVNDLLSVRCRGAESGTEDEYDGDDEGGAVPRTILSNMMNLRLGPKERKTKVKGDIKAGGVLTEEPVRKMSGETTSKKECVVCFEKRSTVYQFPCGHMHCHDCTAQIFRLAVTDRSLLPVRCCRAEVDQSLSKLVLGKKELRVFDQALEEARATNKMYCPRRECGAFINLDKVLAGHKLFFACPSCALSLCSACRASHPNLTCAQYAALDGGATSAEDAAFLQLAEQNKYARCNRCRNFVELKQGCNHMTCVCRYEFCYQCNAQWKTCTCRLWEERNLFEAGREQAGDQRGDERVVRRHMRNLLRVEECAGHHWSRRQRGGLHCQNCSFFMWVYHYGCDNCNHRVCYTCRFHRL